MGGNKIGDIGAKLLLDNSGNLRHLKVLNLSKTSITDALSEGLTYFLDESSTITELYIGWNSFSPSGANKILAGATRNTFLRVLDFSWNMLGQLAGGLSKVSDQSKESCAGAIAALALKNSSIRHLDLSNNGFSFEETRQIAEAFEKNHSIYGFHFEGNHGWVDSKGFLVPLDKKSTKKQGNWEPHMGKKIQGVKGLASLDKVNYLAASKFVHDSCWICDSWIEIEIVWNPGTLLDSLILNDEL